MAEEWTEETFTAHYGYSPQEYFNRVVRGDAAGERIALFEAKIAAWQKELDAVTPGNPGDWTTEAHQKAAELETEINAYNGLIAGDKARQAYARRFLAGEIPDYLPYLGNEGKLLAAGDLIDTTLVPPAEE